MLSFHDEVFQLSKDLDAYEASAQFYLFGVNLQRKMQIFILKTILTQARLELISPEHTCTMIYALMASIPETPRFFGFGSQLKSITSNFLERLHIKDSLDLQAARDFNLQASARLFEGMPSNHHGAAAISFLKKLSLFNNSSDDNPSNKSNTFKDAETDVKQIALYYSEADELKFDLEPNLENINDILLSKFTALPIPLIGEHLRYLCATLLDQIAAEKPANDVRTPKTLLLELLPANLRSDFQKFMEDEAFVTPEEINLYITSFQEFSEGMRGKVNSKGSGRRAYNEIIQNRDSHRKINTLLECTFILAMQFSPNDRILWLADKRFTSFESLMSYVIALPIKLKLDHYDELSARRSQLITQYQSQRERTITLTGQFLRILNDHDYDFDTLPNAINLFSLLDAFAKTPASKKKTAIIKALNKIDPINLMTLTQAINNHIATAVEIKKAAKLLIIDSLAAITHEQSEVYAKHHSQALIKDALQKRFFSFLNSYIEELVTKRAMALLPSNREAIDKGIIPIKAGEDPRLKSEKEAHQAAVLQIIPDVNDSLDGYVSITFTSPTAGTIIRPTADAKNLTATFEPSDINITIAPNFDVNTLNYLIKKYPHDLGPAIIKFMHTGISLEEQKVIKFNESTRSFTSEHTFLPSIAKQYVASCDKAAPVNFIGYQIKTAFTHLIHIAANNYFERIVRKYPNDVEYAKTQVNYKFQGIADFTFDQQGIKGIDITFDPKADSPNTYLAMLRRQLNNNNRFFLNQWLYDSDTTRFIDNMLKNGGGLRLANNTLLCPLSSENTLTFATPPLSPPIARVFSPKIALASTSPLASRLSSASDPSLNESFHNDHCMPNFPEMTLTARACM